MLQAENSTQYTCPSFPTISEIWLAVVPEAAPRYNILWLCFIGTIVNPLRIAAASLLRKGFQRRYSIESDRIRRSPYTRFPGERFLVAKRCASSSKVIQ